MSVSSIYSFLCHLTRPKNCNLLSLLIQRASDSGALPYTSVSDGDTRLLDTKSNDGLVKILTVKNPQKVETDVFCSSAIMMAVEHHE